MSRNKNGIPETGWTCIDIYDLKDRENTYNQGQTMKCEKCKNENLRYVHVMQHPDYPRNLHVGRICAEKMSNDSVGPMEKEATLRSRAKRRQAFCNGDWNFNPDKQTYSRKYKSQYITLKKYKNGSWCIIFKNNFYDYHEGYRIRTLEEAKSAAFDIFEDKMKIGQS